MAIKKQQKRSLEDSQAAPAQSNGPASKKLQKPFKKIKTEKAAQEPAQKAPQTNGVQGKKASKAIKVEKQKSAVEQPKKAKKEISTAALDVKAAAKRLKNAEKLKKKNENRKEARKEQGQYKADKITMSPEAMELRIKEIQGRPEITKTAKRKLAVLKKRLEVARGTYVQKPKVVVSDDAKLSKSQRRALRKKSEAEKRKAKGETSNSMVSARTESLEKGNKKKAAALVKVSEAIKEEKVVKVVDKKQPKAKEAKKLIAKKEEPEESEDEEEDDDDEEEEEEDSDDEAEDSQGSFMNTTEEQDDDEDEDDEEDDEDDDDEDDEEEEDEEEVELPAKKAKQEQIKKQQPAKKEVKQESAQNGDAGKKKRYVLFVGNLPFDATPEDIKKHFLTKVSAVSSVRVPPKPGTTNTSRGFAYVELENAIDYEKGLSLQNTILNGRKLKVEYTQSGSKSAGNRPNVVAKNKKLHAMRKQGMLAGSQKDGQRRNDRRQKQRQQNSA